MSHGYCPYTTVAAVKAADTILGKDRVWSGNDAQNDWVERFYRPIVAALPGIPEIVSNATTVPAEHVSFMKKHGWDAKMTDCKPREFLSAGILDLLVKWKEPGTRTKLKAQDGKSYDAAKLEDGVEFWTGDDGTSMACIATTTADRVWLAMVDKAPTQLQLADAAQALVAGQKRRARHDGLIFPMVDLAAEETLDWLRNLRTIGQDGQEWVVREALQRITLKMNHLGARARAADEMRFVATSVPPPPLTIDRPFLAVFERPGLPTPLFAAYVTQESWKDPGGLEG